MESFKKQFKSLYYWAFAVLARLLPSPLTSCVYELASAQSEALRLPAFAAVAPKVPRVIGDLPVNKNGIPQLPPSLPAFLNRRQESGKAKSSGLR
jgi:hypothetical protein